jgi:hypothetical protein
VKHQRNRGETPAALWKELTVANEIETLFPQLSDDARYLLGREIQPNNWDCDECGCPVCILYLERPRRMRIRCACCGVKAGWVAADNHAVVHRIAAEDRWDRAINRCEKELGSWWFDTWFASAYRSAH